MSTKYASTQSDSKNHRPSRSFLQRRRRRRCPLAVKLAIFVICALAASVFAAPRYKRATRLDANISVEVRAAEVAWTAAEAESDPIKQEALWEAAARAFAAIDHSDTSIRRQAAFAEILAWKNMLAVARRAMDARADISAKPAPRPLDEQAQRIVAAIDRYLKYADAHDAELPGLLFLKAMSFIRVDQLDVAVPILRSIVTRNPRSDVAEFAANHLLDSYNRLSQYDQLVAFADELANNSSFLRDRGDLAALVATIQRQARRRYVETLERAAKASGELEEYVAVGNAYLDLYKRSARERDGDELLYNAGVAFESGRAITDAIGAFELTGKQYPNSKLAAKATARLGVMYGNLAMYARAAEKLEEYAKKYAGEKDALDAISDAVYYRKAVGDRAKAIEDTKYLVGLFGAKRPAVAAEAMWSLTTLYEPNPDAVIKHLREYLRSYAAKGGSERVLIAHAKIGQLLAKQSCPHQVVDGLCVRSNDQTARTCGKGTVPTLTVTARDKKKAAEAVTELTHAVRAQPQDNPEARYYFAQALLALADLELETRLALAFPQGLSFEPATRAASMKRFTAWVDERQKTGAAVTRKYEAVLATKDAACSITAVARLATIADAFATALITADIPRDVRTVEMRKAYCEQMTDTAAPVEERAINAFGVCLTKSTELSWFSESSAYCERRLARLKPEEFPRARELRGTALNVAPVVTTELLTERR